MSLTDFLLERHLLASGRSGQPFVIGFESLGGCLFLGLCFFHSRYFSSKRLEFWMVVQVPKTARASVKSL